MASAPRLEKESKGSKLSKSFSGAGQSASGTALKTALSINATAAIRAGLRFASSGPYLGPASTDFNTIVGIARCTAQGTSAASAPTPLAKDGGDVPAVNTFGWTHSAEPTYTTGTLWWLPGNQRSTLVFQQQDGKEYWSVAGAATGTGIYLVSTTPSTTWQIACTVDFIE